MGELSKFKKRNWNKIYPKVSSDDSGLMLQHLTEIVGSEDEAVYILWTIGKAFYSIADAGKSPLVIYVNDLDPNISNNICPPKSE